jgi:hypothetical protein
MSQPDFKFVNNRSLSTIQSIAQKTGYIEAVRQHLELPTFDTARIHEQAHWHYANGPASFQDPYLLERSWIKAIGEALGINFEFEVDLLISSGRDLPLKPDNPI